MEIAIDANEAGVVAAPEARIACAHQAVVSRPDWARLPGWGDCRVCTASPENARCAGYHPFPAVESPAGRLGMFAHP